MNRNDFKSMSADELWALHEEIATRLAAALTAEKSVLENRLRRLQRGIETQPATDDAKSSGAKSSSTKASTSAAPIPRSFRNIGIRSGRRRPGRDAARSPAGWPHN